MLNESSLIDIQSFTGMYPQIMERIYGLSLISQLADVQHAKYPAIALYALISRYDTEDAHYPLYIISVNDVSLITGETLMKGTSPINIHYQEDNYFLVESPVTLKRGDVLTSENISITLTKASNSRIGVGNLFKKISKFTTDIDNIKCNQSFSLVKAESFPYYKKIKSNFTRESLQDLIYMMDKDEESVKQDLIRQISQEIADETDKDFIDYINSIARKRNPLVMKYAVSGKQSMPDTITEIITNINLAVADVASHTRRGMNMKIIVSPNIAGLILSSVQYSVTSEEHNEDHNPRYIGNIGMSKIFVDHNADREYYTVLYKGDKKGDAAIICSPYELSINWHTEYSSGKENLFYFIRESILRNPQDSGTGIDDSDFAITQDIDIEFQNITDFAEPQSSEDNVNEFMTAFEEQLLP